MTNLLQEIEGIREQRLRSTAISTLCFVLLLSTLFMARAIEWNITGRVISLGTCMFLVLLGLITLLRGGSRVSAAFLGVAGCCIAAGYSSYSSGGLNNPSTGWLIFLPLIASIVGGRVAAVIGFFFSLASLLTLYYLQVTFGAPIDLTPEGFRENQARLNQLGQLLLVFVAIYVLLKQIKLSEQSLSSNIVRLNDEVEARRAAEEKAEHASNIKSAFLANMSHEIRTPMNGVIGALNLLKQQDLSQEREKLVDIGLDSSKTLMVVINDILDLSKIESGKLVIEHRSFDLEAFLEDFEHRSELLAHDKGLAFNLKADIAESRVLGDSVRIRQVMDNLVNNAIKFTDAGSVNVHATLSDPIDGLNLFSVEVIDTGIGIPDQKLEELFAPFTQVDSATTRRFGGTGLGLTICKKLVETMGGSIEACSEPGQGSTFSFSLPLERDESRTKGLKTSQTKTLEDHHVGESQNLARILLVEDNQINIEIAKAMLSEHAVAVELARDGLEALEKLQANSMPFNLVFMDCQMPRMDGYEATRKIREMASKAELPIVAMTANAMQGDKEKCLAAGMNDYLTKPITQEALKQMLKKWL